MTDTKKPLLAEGHESASRRSIYTPHVFGITKRSVLLFVAMLVVFTLASLIWCRGAEWMGGVWTGDFPNHHCMGAQMGVIRSFLLGSVFLLVLWVVGELVHIKFNARLKAEIDGGFAHQNQLRAHEGPRPPPVARLPDWNEELKEWQNRTKQRKEYESQYRVVRAVSLYVMYFLVALLCALIVFAISPSETGPTPTFMTAKYWKVTWDMAFSISGDGVYNIILISSVFLEILLFLMGLVLVRWPHEDPVASPALTPPHPDHPNTPPMREVTQDTCLLIACHESCLTPEREHTFTGTLRAALQSFAPSQIFVCDNGRVDAPVDGTQEVCDRLSREADPSGVQRINYLYIPEGNKTHAMYWTTEYWIPYLVQQEVVPDFEYAVLIDDDVPLPDTFHVPHRKLKADPEIKCVAYAIQAATEDGSSNRLVELQDCEYKFAAFFKQLQANCGSALCAHGAISLWRRDILGRKILWDHDTVFHGEDLYMGLLLHRMGKGHKLKISASTVVPTFAPEDLVTLFRQRTKSWDLCTQRKVFSYLLELFNPHGFLILKPFMFLEVLNIFLDWIRLFLIVYLVIQNLVALVFTSLLYFTLLWVEIILFNFWVMRDRADLRVSAITVALFPFYKTLCLAFRWYALLENIVHYTTWTKKATRISEREEIVQNLPPVPLTAQPDWSVVWQVREHIEQQSDVARYTEVLLRPLSVAKTERRRLSHVVQGYLVHCKLQSENQACNWPALVAHLDPETDSTVTIADLVHCSETLHMQFENFLSRTIGREWHKFKVQLDAVLVSWHQSGQMLFYSPDLLNATQHSANYTLLNNERIIRTNIKEAVERTRYPENHDQVRGIKDSIAKYLRLLHQLSSGAERAEGTNRAMTELLGALENIKATVQSASNGDSGSLSQLARCQQDLQRWQSWLLQNSGNVHGKWKAKIPDLLELVTDLQSQVSALSAQ